MSRATTTAAVAVAVAAGLGALAGTIWRAPVLWSGGEAAWILVDAPYALEARLPADRKAEFRSAFELDRRTTGTALELQFLGTAGVVLDGELIAAPIRSERPWRRPVRVSLPPLEAGSHELRIQVVHRMGPPAIRARSEELGIASGTHWQARQEDGTTLPVRRADAPLRAALSDRFPTSVAASRQLLPTIGLAFALGASLWWLGRRRFRAIEPDRLLRWALWGFWIAMALNNLWTIPPWVGFDAAAHLEYVLRVAADWTPPLPDEGWQAFQSPLYYYVSAVLWRLLEPGFGPESAGTLLRLVPLAAGALQIELAWAALRLSFPGSPGARAVGLLVAGLLPMNLYLAHYLGNEPLAALLIGLVLVLLLRELTRPESPPDRRAALLLGLVWGAALLTKATAVLLAPLVVAVLWGAFRRSSAPPGSRLAPAMLATATAVLVSAPYYLRNLFATGSAFVGGWDPARIPWWQEPGYRVPEHFFRFGGSLTQPLYAGTLGLWDSLYSTLWTDGFLGSMITFEGRPPWRLPHLTALALVSLVPTALLLLGVFRGIAARDRGVLFSLATAGVFLGAVTALYLRLPIYSTGKATYLLGLTPLLALVAGRGWLALPGRARWGWVGAGALTAWAAIAALTFFVP